MSPNPKITFLSLFVSNLDEAIDGYQSLLGVSPESGAGAALAPHPFATRGPVVFQLGEVALALYECDGQTTHPGDVGIGLETDLELAASELREHGGHVFWGPASLDANERRLAIGVSPDRHFFEIVAGDPATAGRIESGN